MTDNPRTDWTEEEKKAWIFKHLSGRCVGCKATLELFRKLFFTKSS